MKEKKEKPYVVTERQSGTVRLICARSKSQLMQHLLNGFDIRPMKPEDLMNMVDGAAFETVPAQESGTPGKTAKQGITTNTGNALESEFQPDKDPAPAW